MNNQQTYKNKHIHFVGIKGVGMTALAIIAKEAGAKVSGSDIPQHFITSYSLKQAGITAFTDFCADHINGAQLVVTTGAHNGFKNIEVKEALDKGIRVVSMAQAVGMLMDGELFGRKLLGISIAGTHGKTTTTAMIATILKANKMDPSYFIGTGYIPSLGIGGHYGKGDYFVAEADEYASEPVQDKRPKFFWHHPKIAVITNIEHDHPDIYPDLDSFRAVFKAFVSSLASDTVLIVCGDDHEIQKLITDCFIKKVTYGFNSGNDIVLTRFCASYEKTFFHATAYGSDLGEFMINVPGKHNCLNALASVATCLEVGLSLVDVKMALKSFSGSKRRLEYIGQSEQGAILYDDYGHHPTEIKATMSALRAMYPKKQIICIFQPHTYSRTSAFFSEFTRAFNDADTVVMQNIFSSAREVMDVSVSSKLLVDATKKIHKDVLFLPTAEDVLEYLIKNKFDERFVIITMGAGDVYKINEKLKVKS
jgi:UDP-N-acetylmuramate--alanine ligase